MSEKKRNNDWIFKSRDNHGRFSGKEPVSYDDYSEESGGKVFDKRPEHVRFPHDKDAPESLSGPVIVVKEGRKKDG